MRTGGGWRLCGTNTRWPDEYNMLARLYSGLANLTTEGKDTAEVTALIEQQLEYIKGYE